jgi:hypothetical protein
MWERDGGTEIGADSEDERWRRRCGVGMGEERLSEKRRERMGPRLVLIFGGWRRKGVGEKKRAGF